MLNDSPLRISDSLLFIVKLTGVLSPVALLDKIIPLSGEWVINTSLSVPNCIWASSEFNTRSLPMNTSLAIPTPPETIRAPDVVLVLSVVPFNENELVANVPFTVIVADECPIEILLFDSVPILRVPVLLVIYESVPS